MNKKAKSAQSHLAALTEQEKDDSLIGQAYEACESWSHEEFIRIFEMSRAMGALTREDEGAIRLLKTRDRNLLFAVLAITLPNVSANTREKARALLARVKAE